MTSTVGPSRSQPASFSLTVTLSAELDDAALDDDGDEMTEEQHGPSSPFPPLHPHPSPCTAQMESGVEQIRAVVGDEATSGLDDAIIRDTLWQFYFNIEQSIAWLFGSSSPCHPALLSHFPEEQERRTAARERKGRPSYLLLFLA